MKKRLKNYEPPQNSKRHSKNKNDSKAPSTSQIALKSSHNFSNIQEDINGLRPESGPNSPQLSSSEMSTVTANSLAATMGVTNSSDSSENYIPEIDESFWTDDLSTTDNSNFDMMVGGGDDLQFHDMKQESVEMDVGAKLEDDMDFWYNVFIKTEDLPELPEF